MKLLSLRVGLLVAAIVGSSSASAEIVSYKFEGTIDRHTGDLWSEVGFGIGDVFTGQYTFESTTPGFSAVPMFNVNGTAYTLKSFTVTSQGNTITSEGERQNGIVVDDGFSSTIDAYFVVLSSVSSYNELYIDLRSTNSNLFTSEDLPLVLPHLSNFDNSSLFRVRTLGSNGDFSWAQGDIDSLQVVNLVPELFCDGFYAPLDNGAVSVKKNRVLPHKAILYDASGYDITDIDISSSPIVQVSYSSDALSSEDVTDQALQKRLGAVGNQFVYLDEDNKWHYNFNTKSLSAKGTYTITIMSGDSSEYVIEPPCTSTFVIKR